MTSIEYRKASNDSLLRRFEYTYNSQNFVASQKVYDESYNYIEWKEYEYDTLGRLTKETTKNPVTQQVINTLEFQMDDIGNITNELNNSALNANYTYSSNNMNELIKVKEDEIARTNPGTVNVWGKVSVDDGASISFVKVNDLNADYSAGYFTKNGLSLSTNPSQTVTAVVTDSRGYVTNHTVTLSYDQMADIAYAYDLRGNMIYKSEHGAETLYIYDDRDFLKEAHLPNGDKVFIETGPSGRRLKRKFYDASAQTWETTYYSYAGIQGIADYDANWNLDAYYIPGLGIDRIEIMRKNNTDYYFVRDHLGSVRLVLDSDCNIVEEYEYSTYGELTIKDAYGQTITESAIGNRHTYTGREWDENLELYYYRARWYDPIIRRFTQKDIIHFTNRYIYVENNPMNFFDPYGNDIWIETVSSKYNHKTVYFSNYDGTATGYDLMMGKKIFGWPCDLSGNVRLIPAVEIDKLKNHYMPSQIPGQEGVYYTYIHYRYSEDQTKAAKKWAHERYKNQDYPYIFPISQCWTFVNRALQEAWLNGRPYDPLYNDFGITIDDILESSKKEIIKSEER